jgi:predicted RNA-binding protein associated with RNAse of E/G family
VQVFTQAVVERTPRRVVTFLEAAELPRPVRVAGEVVLEAGSPVVWFTYPGRWHDIGRFHRADGTFTGTYANVLTPVRMDGARWETTDLCLDVWLGADGRVEVLDEDELDEALARGWTDAVTAARARGEARALADAARAGLWPPAHVAAWPLHRARQAAAAARPTRNPPP